ncbi:MAG TPA: alkaline phosphatase family protein, partial [Gaiellaceae bacterium]|nr:alkaline phosphatase family protein [Gaiellaceae bacterium]
MTSRKKLILVVIDGLTPDVFEAVDDASAPTLAALAAAGNYRRAFSTFPSLTPVCLASIATGGGPDVHGIPHLTWYHRGERRLVEYGSSFGAIRAAGTRRAIRDAIVEMNAEHLSKDAVTLYEALEDEGLATAAVNVPCYRGRTRHAATLPGVRAVEGPRRFFYYSLFESD